MAGAPGHVVLVGLMGSGKTTVGRRLARRLDRPFVDADEEIERASGRTVAALFAERGEDGFRSVEADVLADLVARSDPTVVAAGGGVVVTEANRALLASPGVFVVWLDGSPAFLASRAKPKPHRPLLEGEDPRTVLSRLHAQRAGLYREVADLVVDVEPFHREGERSKARLAEHVADRVRHHEDVTVEQPAP